MSLPYDFARCVGKSTDEGEVLPECIDCQRRTSRPDVKWLSYFAEPPKERPCPDRIGEQA